MNESKTLSLIGKLAVVNIYGNATHVRTAKTTFKMCALQTFTFKWDTGKPYSCYGDWGIHVNAAGKPYNLMGNIKFKMHFTGFQERLGKSL